MAVYICCMQENLRWDEATSDDHFNELRKFDEFNYYISEYFDAPAPARSTLDACATLMGWAGDAKQITAKITGQNHTDEKKFPVHFRKFLAELKTKSFEKMSKIDQELFRERMTDRVDWQKFDDEKERYNDTTPLNSYDVLKCSQACFHLFEYMSSLLPEDERPPRFVEIDIKAYRKKKIELERNGSWPKEPPKGPAEREE